MRYAVADVRRRSRLPTTYEFSFHALSSAPLRRRVFTALTQADFESWAVVIDKTVLSDSFRIMQRLDFYLYFVTEALQLIPAVKREGATLILDEFGGAIRIQSELRRVMQARDVPRHFKRVLAKRSRGEPLIQVADLIAGAILHRDARDDADAYGSVEGKLKKILEFRG